MKRWNGRPIVPVACLLLVGALLVPVAASAQQVSIEGVSFDSDSIVDTRGDVVYLWQSETHTLDVTLSTPGSEGTGHYEFCVRSRSRANDTYHELDCRTEEVAGNATDTVTFEFERWPGGLTGRQSVNVVVRPDTLGEEVVANETIAIHVLAATADDDGDGLTNKFEVAEGTNFSDADTDGDGLRDNLEVNTYETDPGTPDSDGDGLSDGDEIHEWGTDPTDPDTDGDGLSDHAEVEEYGTNPHRPDTDGDGLADAREVHTHDTDPTSADTDHDGLDDRAEVDRYGTNPTDPDSDGDGLRDSLEIHTYDTDPTVPDTDGDGLEDGPEVHTHDTDPTNADTDGDGLADGPEVNVYGTNSNAVDTDGDGLTDGSEVHRFETNPNDPDTDNDGQDDLAEVRGGLPFVPPPPRDLLLYALGGTLLVGAAIAYRRRQFPDVGILADRSGSSTGKSADAVDRSASVPREAGGPPFRSSEEEVLSVLSEHGGRMRQSAIVDDTGWSKSKVSRVLSRMAAEGQVSKIDVGRGNIIAIPGHEPEHSRPPFEEE